MLSKMYQKRKELAIISQIGENRMLLKIIRLFDVVLAGAEKKGVKIEAHSP